jgi:hypothetical protein
LRAFSWSHALLLFLILLPASLGAQPAATPRTPPGTLKVFLDCRFECDTEYLRQNIDFIDYVRDRETADVHVLVTTQGTGGGGMSWTVRFIGLDYFKDHEHTLTFTTLETASSDDRRKEFARVFKVGLVTYAAETDIAPNLEVSLKAFEGKDPTDKPTRDPWNYWVFRLGAGGDLNGERSSNNRSYRVNISASRVTEQWKINASLFGDTSRSSFKVTDDFTVTSNTNSWNLSTLVVKSLGPRWSYGARSSFNRSSFSNTDRSIGAFPAIEFDFFPYSESSRRSLTVQYSVGITSFNYREVTIFDKLEETVPSHSLRTSLGVRSPWGSLGGSANISQHLNHVDRYRISLNGNTDIRLFKGFSFNIWANYDKIGDQIGLRKADATTEEVLLRLQQRATGYSYYLNFGFSYSFGSIFNSTVNPRFGGF